MSTTPCVKCGEPLAPGVRFCPNCGTRQPDHASDTPTEIMPPTSSAPSQGSGQSQSAVPPTILAGPPQSYGPSQTPPQGYGAPPPTPYGDYGAAQQPAPAKKSRMPLILGILGAVALCIVIGIVAAFIGLNVLGRRVSGVFATTQAGLSTLEPTSGSGIALGSTAQPTRVRATATARPTVAEATATEEAATETVFEGTPIVENPTPTEEAAAPTEEITATEGVTETEQPQLSPEEQAARQATAVAASAGATVAFHDEFVDNRNAWFIGRFEDKETNKIENGVFRVIRDSKGRSFELWQVRPLTNFVAEVDCQVLEGNDGGCGLVYGENPDQGHWEYEVFNDYYRLSIIEGDKTTKVLEGDPTSIMRANEVNKIRVVRRDGIAYLFINDTLVNQSDDNRFDKGRVGVLTSSYQDSGSVEVEFDNFVVSEFK